MASKLQLAGILIVLGTAGTAAAEIDVRLSAVPGHGAPQVEAVIQGAHRVPLSEIKLVDSRGTVVPATDITDFQHGRETIAIAFVVEGGEVWLGNDTFEPEDSPARYAGALEGIRRGFTHLDLARTMPPHSLGMLVMYDDRIHVRVPMGPIRGLTAESFGTQRDYYGRIGQSLVQATEEALAALEDAPTHKKVLIVIGDGNDTNPEAAKGQLAELKKRAAIANIEVTAIIYKGQLSEPSNTITAFAPRAVTANSFEGIANAMQEAVRRATSQYTVRFPGDKLTWDGTSQELTIRYGASELEPVTLNLGSRPPASSTRWYVTWWAQLGAGLVLVGLIAGFARLRGRSTI